METDSLGNFKFQVIEYVDPRWEFFQKSQAMANIFHHPAWQDLLKKCYGYRPFVLAVCDADGAIHAGLPVMEVDHTLRGRRWISLPFSDHCAPLVSEQEAVRLFASFVRSCFTTQKSRSIEIRWDMPDLRIEQTNNNYVLHRLPLEPDLEKIESRIHLSHRRNVRIAQERGVRIRHGTDRRDLTAFYNLHLETRRSQGMPIQPAKYFQLLQETILAKGLGFISLAFHGPHCLAGAVFLHWNNTLTYKYGASTKAGLSLRPNHLIFWDAIQWGCEHGYSLLDFGRSDCDNDGLRVFKSRWGAVEEPLRYSIMTAKPYPPMDGRLMNILNYVIKNSPMWVCKLSGEFLYRYYG